MASVCPSFAMDLISLLLSKKVAIPPFECGPPCKVSTKFISFLASLSKDSKSSIVILFQFCISSIPEILSSTAK